MGLFNMPEKELANYIYQISSGNKDVLEEFYNKYAKSMYTLIYSYVRSKESAEEVLQDVLMSIVTYGFAKRIKNPKAWLYKVIKNISVKKAEEDKKRQTESLSDNEDLVSECNVFSMIEDSIEQIESLECLNPMEQQCVLLCVFGGFKLPKVAEIMDIPYDRLRSIYYYSIRKLRQYYERKGSDDQQRSNHVFV